MERRITPVSIFAVFAMLISAGAGMASAMAQGATPASAGSVDVTLTNVSGEDVGTATFEESSDGEVTISVSVEGLEPGEHGIHVHGMGICDPSGEEPFSTAGVHYNPTDGSHGIHEEPDSHAGDLGNITIDDDGTGTLEVTTDRFTLSEGTTSLLDEDGSALLIHRNPDDLETDPAGQSGARIVCGVVAEPASLVGTPTPAELVAHNNPPEQVDFSEDLLNQLEVPEGFEIDVFAQGLTNPRMMVVVSDSVVLVSEPEANSVMALRDTDGDGSVDESEAVASDLEMVHGMAIREDTLYLAGPNAIWTADLEDDGTLGTPEALFEDLPAGGQHGRPTLAFGPDDMLYVSIGSTCNACPETNDENATLLRMSPDGSERTIFASGLRNTIAWGWHPETDDLWGIDQGSDWRGSDEPPEELNLIVENANYGWPYCFGEQQIDEYIPYSPPGATPEQFCEESVAPTLVYQAHSSPIGMAYYTADQFPEGYQGDAFITMRGSWNRMPATGYKVLRLQFEDGEPVEFSDFITGWLLDDGEAHFGRIAGLAVMPDGSLLIAEDTNGVIYRVTYSGE